MTLPFRRAASWFSAGGHARAADEVRPGMCASVSCVGVVFPMPLCPQGMTADRAGLSSGPYRPPHLCLTGNVAPRWRFD